MFGIELFFLLLIAAIVALCTTKTYQIKRMARTWGLRYQAQTDSLLTVSTAKYVRLFGQGIHRFFYVLTWRESTAFVCVCEDRVFTANSTLKPYAKFTLASAELTRGTFTPFVLMPRSDVQEPRHPALPDELADRFVLQAPVAFRFPPAVLALLRQKKKCYLEASELALVYHEYGPIPPSKIQLLHIRMNQLVKLLTKAPPPLSATFRLNQQVAAELQANMLLQSHRAPGMSGEKASTARWGYGILWLFLMAALLVGAHYILHNFIGH